MRLRDPGEVNRRVGHRATQPGFDAVHRLIGLNPAVDGGAGGTNSPSSQASAAESNVAPSNDDGY